MNKHIFPLLLWLIVLHLVLPVVLSGVGAAAHGAPNLMPFKPEGWSDWLVVADTASTTTDSGSYTVGETLYVSWAVINWSTEPSGPFRTTIYIDGAPFRYWDAGGLNSGYYINLPGYPMGSLCAGSHTIKIVADSDNAVTETNETDNDYSKTITVVPGNDSGIIESSPTVESCPGAFTFPELEVAVGRETRTFAFSNVGNGNLDIHAVGINGQAAEDFTVIIDTCSGKTLPPVACGGSCVVGVAFSTLAAGDRNALLSIFSSDQQTPVLSLPLSGVGLPARGDIDRSGLTGLADVIVALQVAVGAAGQQDFDLGSTVNTASVGLQDAVYALQKVAQSNAPIEYELVKVRTDFGDIMIWLFDQTPIHRDNFLSLARQGFYDGLLFHRVIDGFMIQGGDPLGTGSGGPGYTLPAEINCAFTHVQGAVAAARQSDSVNPEKRSSGSQFYIVENKAGTHLLDQEYTVFGQVIDGIATAEAIAEVTTDENNRPSEDVVMTTVEVVTLTAAELADQYGFTVPE